MPHVSVQKLLILLLPAFMASIKGYSQLVADFTISQTGGCSPLTVSFTNQTRGASAGASYLWDLGNGNVSTETNAAAIYTEEKTYTVKLTVTDANKTTFVTKTVTVYKKPSIQLSTDITRGCAPLNATLTATATAGDGTIQNYFWDFGDGNTLSGSGPQVPHTYTFAQQASVSLTVTNSMGCQSTLLKDSLIEVLPVLEASFAANQTFLCRINDAVTFTNTSKGPGTLSYAWTFGDGSTSTTKEPSHVFNTRGTYDVSLQVKSSEGCTNTKTLTGYLNVANYQSEIIAPNINCTGQEMKFLNRSTPQPFMTQWNIPEFGDGYTYGQQSVVYYVYNPGTYKLRMINTFGGCKDTVYKDFTVKKSPNLNGWIAERASPCAIPVDVQFKDTTSDAVKWNWNFFCNYNCPAPDATIKEPIKKFDFASTYNVMLTVTNAEGCSNSWYQYLDLRQPDMMIDLVYSSGLNNYRYGCLGLTLGFKASRPDLIASYQWSFSDDNSSSTNAQVVHVFNKAGIHKVTLKYVLTNGCTGTVTYDDIRVRAKPKFDFTSLSGTEICGNTPVQFSATGNEYQDWYWDFGDGKQEYHYGGNSNGVSHKYEQEGTYTITLSGQIENCFDTVQKVAYIHVSPPFPKISGYTNTCEGTRGLVVFSETSKQTNSWSWDFGDGSSTTYSTYKDTIQHTYTKTGTYKTVLTTVNGSCTVKDSMLVQVLLKQSPQLSATTTNVCSNDGMTITLDHLERNWAAYYDWAQYSTFKFEYGNGELAQVWSYGLDNYDSDPGMHLKVLQMKRGSDQLRVVLVSDHFQCFDTTNYIPISVRGPIANYSLKTAYCDATLQFIDSSKGSNNVPITSWSWSFGDGQGVTNNFSAPFTHTYPQPYSYDVYLTVKDAEGCTDQKWTPYVRVGGVQAAFNVSANTISPNSSVSFYNNSFDNYTGSTTYEWQFGDGTTSTDFNTQHTYTQPGNYTVLLLARNATYACTDTARQTIIVKYINSAFSMGVSYLNNSTCPPVLVNFTNTSSNASRVTWDFGDGARSENVFNPSHLYTAPGQYIITLNVYSDNGTVYTTKDSVIIKSSSASLNANQFMSCTAQSISFNSPGKYGRSYAWDYGDGLVKVTTDSTSVHSFTAAGVYAPTLVVKDADGCSAAASLANKIVVDSLQINIGNIPSACTISNISFQPQVTSIAADRAQQTLYYHWDFGTGILADSSNVKQPNFTYTQPGNYTVRFRVASPSGCLKETTKTVVVDEKIKGIINGPAAICEGGSASFKGSAVTTPQSWSWNLGQGITSIQQDPAPVTYALPGNYTVALMLKNGSCIDTTLHQLTVNPKPVISLGQREAVLCSGSTMTLHASGGAVYNWQPATGLDNNTIADPIASPTSTTTYVLEAKSGFGCAIKDSVKITVAPPMNLTINPGAVICNGNNVQLIAGGASSYHWIGNTAGLNNVAIANPVARPGSTTTYYVEGRDSYQCFIDTASVTVTVNPLPAVQAGADIVVTGGTPYQLKPVYSNDVVSYSWLPANDLSCSDCPSPMTTPTADRDYIITVTNAFLCTAADTIKVVTECGESHIYIPNAFTPNGDALNNTFTIRGSGVKQVTSFAIFNRWGELVFEKKNFMPGDAGSAWNGKFRGLNVPAGSYVYLASFQCASGQVFSKKGTVTVIY
ncbi:MAG TPA: PKD domain-containing protein [Flavisolibacter sp.]|nr:PKD domain-containing protein [Flavisolibacter sp.]